MIEIIPTNTCPSDLAELSRRSKTFSEFSPWVQLDIDDGAFAPVISWPYGERQWAELEAMATDSQMLPYADTLKYETHLMVEEPSRLGELLARIGVPRIIGHVEAFADAEEIRTALHLWKNAGAPEVGLAILLDTPLPVLAPVVPLCDVVQVMAIAVLGSQGAPFEARIIPKIRELSSAYPDIVIEVDGGVSKKTIATLVHAGASRFGVGSAISKAPDPQAAYEELKLLAENALQ
jgi:ribulose-phosphate 3-epimerase